MCHTPRSGAGSAGDVTDAWRCRRCGQHWDARRVAAVAAYAAWSREHDRVSDGAEKPSYRNSVAAAVDGAP
jgi:hypothetical protein